MQRSRLILFIFAVLLLTLSLPAMAGADETVDSAPTESVVPVIEPTPDGWTWDEAQPVPDGWTWDEATARG